MCARALESYVRLQDRWRDRRYIETRSDQILTAFTDETFNYHIIATHCWINSDVYLDPYALHYPKVGSNGKLTFGSHSSEDNTEYRVPIIKTESLKIIVDGWNLEAAGGRHL